MTAILLDVAWKSVVVLGITFTLLQLLRQRSAAQRAWIAHIGLIATLLLPLAVTLLPRWEVAAAVPMAQIAQPVAKLFEAPAVIDASPRFGEAVSAQAPVVSMTAHSWLSTLISTLAEPANLAALLYGLPAALLLLLMLVAVGRLFALRARAMVMVEQSWLTALAHAQRRMNFKHGTALLVSNEIHSPISWGVLRPVILLNEDTLSKNDDAEAIIAHELAHVARLDWASLLLGRIATALFWFNPLVWLVARQAHQLREEAADDAVLCSNVNRLDYAALLVGAARLETRGFFLAANSVAPSNGSLRQRITRVLDEGQLRVPAYLGWVGICVLGSASLTLPLAAFSPITTPQSPLVTLTSQPPVAAKLAQHHRLPPSAPAPHLSWAASESRLPMMNSNAGMTMMSSTPAPDTMGPIADDKPSAEDLIEKAVLESDQRYREEIVQAGYPSLSDNELDQIRAQNVRGAWLRELASLGYASLSPEEIANMAIHNVSADFVRRVAKVTSVRPTPEELVNMRIHGVMPDRNPGPPGGVNKDNDKN
jgi:beta-lactamase regulating signal transducer with metallopeptidase domain